MPEDYVVTDEGAPVNEPEVHIDLNKRVVEIKFPPDFLVNLQQHENTGEKLVIRALAQGLIRFHQGSITELQGEETLVGTLSKYVIGDQPVLGALADRGKN